MPSYDRYEAEEKEKIPLVQKWGLEVGQRI